MLLLKDNMAQQNNEIPYGTLDLMVLKTLAAMGPLHGYGIARRIEQVAAGALALNQGTIYPALLRLEQKGVDQERLGHEREQPARPLLRHHRGRTPAAGARGRRSGRGPCRWSTACWRTNHDGDSRCCCRGCSTWCSRRRRSAAEEEIAGPSRPAHRRIRGHGHVNRRRRARRRAARLAASIRSRRRIAISADFRWWRWSART